MSYFAVCTFDLKNAVTKDYQTAYEILDKIGFKKQIHTKVGRTISLPTTTTAGTFTGTSSDTIRKELCNHVQKEFSAKGFTSEIIIIVGENWSWEQRTTKRKN